MSRLYPFNISTDQHKLHCNNELFIYLFFLMGAFTCRDGENNQISACDRKQFIGIPEFLSKSAGFGLPLVPEMYI